ncbi:MAG: TlpA family protein disulfide reductase [Opitutaceae bacterium]
MRRLVHGGAAALFLLLAVHPAVAEPLKAGAVFPDFAGFELTGNLPELGEAKVVIVDFWASWCAPCKASFPVFDSLYREFGDKGLVIIAVSVDRNAKAMEAFLQRMKPAFSVVRDTQQKLVAAVEAPAMPTSFVLDGDRRVRFVHEGFHGEKSRREYEKEIASILAETP